MGRQELFGQDEARTNTIGQRYAVTENFGQSDPPDHIGNSNLATTSKLRPMGGQSGTTDRDGPMGGQGGDHVTGLG